MRHTARSPLLSEKAIALPAKRTLQLAVQLQREGTRDKWGSNTKRGDILSSHFPGGKCIRQTKGFAYLRRCGCIRGSSLPQFNAWLLLFLQQKRL